MVKNAIEADLTKRFVQGAGRCILVRALKVAARNKNVRNHASISSYTMPKAAANMKSDTTVDETPAALEPQQDWKIWSPKEWSL